MKRFLALYAAAAYAFLYLPILVLAAFSVNASKVAVWRGFTGDWYRAVFSDPALLDGTQNSLIIAISATAISTVIGTLLAYALWKRRAPLLSGALLLSLLTPEIVAGVSLLAFFQWLFRYARLQLGLHTVILAHVSFCLAYVVIVVLARLRTMDDDTRGSGAGSRRHRVDRVPQSHAPAARSRHRRRGATLLRRFFRRLRHHKPGLRR